MSRGFNPLVAVVGAGEKDYPVQPVPFTQVQLTDGFWSPCIETNRTVTIPFAFEQSWAHRGQGEMAVWVARE